MLSNGNMLDFFKIPDNRFIEGITGNTERFADDDPAQAEYGYISRTTAHIDYHGAIGTGYVQAGPDSGSQRFFHNDSLAGPGLHSCFDDGALFYIRCSRRNADNNPRLEKQGFANSPADKIPQHIFSVALLIGNDSPAEGMIRLDMLRGPPQHGLCLFANSHDTMTIRIKGDDSRFIDDNSLFPDIDNDIGRAQINGNITAKTSLPEKEWEE